MSSGAAHSLTYLLGLLTLTIAPKNVTFFLRWGKWGFDFRFRISHTQWTFLYDNVFSPTLSTFLMLMHLRHPINCFTQCSVPHVIQCDANPTVEIFHGNLSGNFPAHLAFLYKGSKKSISSISWIFSPSKKCFKVFISNFSISTIMFFLSLQFFSSFFSSFFFYLLDG